MPLKDKGKGILMPIFSLPSAHGIGDFNAAYMFADFLKAARQDYWQILPLVPIGEGNSPYKTVCSLAGEPLFISLDWLWRDGLLTENEIAAADNSERINYEAVRNFKMPLIKKAAERFDTRDAEFKSFLKENDDWLSPFAVFSHFNGKISELPNGIKFKDEKALESFTKENEEELLTTKVIQFFFAKQFFLLKEKLTKNGIKLIGDMPFYVAPDSTDVWTNPDNFILNRDFSPALMAGTPPDLFSAKGQLWGNPIYDFEYQEKTDFKWWKKRFCAAKELYDVLRIDHFRAFANYYVIDGECKSAENGKYLEGVGEKLFEKLSPIFKNFPLIAEDLGGERDESVQNLIKKLGIPNMKVLQFAFNSDRTNPFLPQNFGKNTICYTGTHDNDTIYGWYKKCTAAEKAVANCLLPYRGYPISYRMIRAAAESRARLSVIPLADFLSPDIASRINTPATESGNWEWRITKSTLTAELADDIKALSER